MFQNFLDRVLPDKEYQQALQEYVGYCLTDDFTLEKIVILLGNGSNGKSVFQHIITAMLGEDNVSTYGLNELIAGNHQDNARYTAFQKKVNIGTEIGNIKDASMDIFKKMISNEQVMVRKMHHEPFNIKWKPKLMFNANTLPSAEITKAYERRMLIIPFEVSINSNEADPRLAKKIITSELAGVLNWALQGLERIYKNNLKLTISDNLIMTSRDHLNATNTVITFLEESGILPTSDNSTIYKLKDLMGKYIDYMKSIGGVHKSYRSFEMTLRLENFIIVKTTTTRVKCVVAKIPAVLGLHPVYEKFQKVMS
jgi:putative DNA primase/helicase